MSQPGPLRKESVLSVPFEDNARLVLGNTGRPETVFAGSAISMGGLSPLPDWTQYVAALLRTLGKSALSRPPLPAVLTPEDEEDIKQLLKTFRSKKIQLHQITDTINRRLGVDYTKVIKAGFEKKFETPSARGACNPSPPDVHRGLITDLLEGRIQVLVTTNFDMRLEDALLELTHGSLKYKQFRLSSTESQPEDSVVLDKKKYAAWELATTLKKQQLGGTVTSEEPSSAALELMELMTWCEEDPQAHRAVIVIVPSWKDFRQLVMLFPTFAKTHLPFRFLLKIHGSANEPTTCIDSSYQREQGLPSPVKLALWSIYANTRVTFLGFSGAELQENPDYFQILTAASFSNIDIRWSTRDPEQDNLVVRQLQDEVLRLDTEPSNVFDRPVASISFGTRRADLGAFQAELETCSALADKPWCCASLLDLLAQTTDADGALDPVNLERLFKKLWIELRGQVLVPDDYCLPTEAEPPAKAFALLRILGRDFGRGLPTESPDLPDDKLRLWSELDAHRAGLILKSATPSTYRNSTLVSKSAGTRHTDSEILTHKRRFDHAKTALDLAYLLVQQDYRKKVDMYKAGIAEIRERLLAAEATVLDGDFYGVHSDMYILWATYYVLQQMEDPTDRVCGRLLRSSLASASVTGNVRAQRYLRDLMAGDGPTDFPVNGRKTPPQEGVMCATHIYVADLDNMSPSLYDQEVPFGDHLRGLLTYALLLRPRIIATETIFNSRTLVTKVLCPWDPVKKKHTLNLQIVSRLDLWVFEKPSQLQSKPRAHQIREEFVNRSRDKTFLLDIIPYEALEPLLDYYDKNPKQMLAIDDLEDRSAWRVRFCEGLARALDHGSLPSILGGGPCPWLKQRSGSQKLLAKAMLGIFNERIVKFKNHFTTSAGLFRKEGFSRSAAYAYLGVQPLPSNMTSSDWQQSYASMLASIAIRHTVDAVYVHNLPCYKRISCLASDASARSLDIAALAYQGILHKKYSFNTSFRLPDAYNSDRGNPAPTPASLTGNIAIAHESPVIARPRETSFSALRAVQGQDFEDLYDWIHMGSPLESLPSLTDELDKVRIPILPNRPSDTDDHHRSKDCEMDIAERKKLSNIITFLQAELLYPKSMPLPSLYQLPRFFWGDYHYTWNSAQTTSKL